MKLRKFAAIGLPAAERVSLEQGIAKCGAERLQLGF